MFSRYILVLSLLLTLLFPSSAFAYSYGDPNKEPIAETFKDIAAKLEQKPEDWNGAYQAFRSRQSEISLEFGEKIAKLLDDNLKQKQKDLILSNYKSLLVMNINRRLDNAEQQFSDYAKAKLLLAKGRGTLTVLAPYIDEKASKTILSAFDSALNALGNPGLFGVGAVSANQTKFLSQTALIRKTLQPLFPMKDSAGEAPKATEKQADKPAAQPAKQTTATKPNSTPQAASDKPSAPVNIQPASAQPAAANGTDSSVQADTTAVAPAATSVSSKDTAAPASDPPKAAAASKVNPLVTFGVIGGFIAIAGLLMWVARRKMMI